MAEITRETLELAALAAGHTINERMQAERDALIGRKSASLWIDDVSTAWNPGRDDGDAARLAVRLEMWTNAGIASLCDGEQVIERAVEHDGTEPDKLRAWREAVVLCAAAVGAEMKGGE